MLSFVFKGSFGADEDQAWATALLNNPRRRGSMRCFRHKWKEPRGQRPEPFGLVPPVLVSSVRPSWNQNVEAPKPLSL